jgi:hypothetical protein
MSAFVQRVALDRFQGDRPSVVRAIGAAVAVGAAAAVMTYKVLRS